MKRILYPTIFLMTCIVYIMSILYTYVHVSVNLSFGICIVGLVLLTVLLITNKNKYYKSKKWKSVLESNLQMIDNINNLNTLMAEKHDECAFHQTKEFSRSVIEKAKQNELKYLCKYFNVSTNEKTVDAMKYLSNTYTCIENNFVYVNTHIENIVNEVKHKIPFLVRIITFDIVDKIGIKNRIKYVEYPTYCFFYRSRAGKVYKEHIVVLTPGKLNAFVKEMNGEIAYRKTVNYQRSLMTDALREKIKKRDNYTCQICGASTYDFPDLILHIDHIKPVSKGGLTEESNLQTLCAQCNLHKSNKY